MTRTLRRVLVVAASASVLVASAVLGGDTKAFGSSTVAPTTAQPGRTYTVHLYTYPKDLREARAACFRAENAARPEVPATLPEYTEWFEANRGTPAQREWSAAYESCKARHELPGGKWNWSAMVYLGTETRVAS